MKIKQARKIIPSRASVFSQIIKKHWSRIKSIDFPAGPVRIRDSGGFAVIRRPHSRRELRQMARLAARREFKVIATRMKGSN